LEDFFSGNPFVQGKIIQGKAYAESKINDLRQKVEYFYDQTTCFPKLAVILVGDHPASEIYVTRKKRACEEIGVLSDVHRLSNDASLPEILELVHNLNQDSTVHGILVQLPLPDPTFTETIIGYVDPLKDIDGLTPQNLGLLLAGTPRFIPCTPKGCLALLEGISMPLSGIRATVIGRSILVGRSMATLLMQKDATVTIAHSKTKNLKEVTQNADLIIACAGQPSLIQENMVKEGAVILDVGIHRLESGKIVGDVDFNGVYSKVAAITPVPGGIGPMTIASLLENTLLAAYYQHHLNYEPR